MTKFYLLGAFVAIVALAYFAGERAGRIKCHSGVVSNVAEQQMEIINIQRAVNEDSVNRGVGDIRRVLRERYTIGE